MREILFRGKHIHALPQNEHLDGTWVYGYLCDENYINSPELEGEFLIDPETVCQYTGLTDKNGRKIFEGDCLGHKENVVEYICGGFVVRGDRPLSLMAKYNEVVGNIFDKE